MKFIRSFSLLEISYFLNLSYCQRNFEYLNYLYLSEVFNSSFKDVIILNNLYFLKYLNNINCGLAVSKPDFLKYLKFNVILSLNPRLSLSKISTLCLKKKNI